MIGRQAHYMMQVCENDIVIYNVNVKYRTFSFKENHDLSKYGLDRKKTIGWKKKSIYTGKHFWDNKYSSCFTFSDFTEYRGTIYLEIHKVTSQNVYLLKKKMLL